MQRPVGFWPYPRVEMIGSKLPLSGWGRFAKDARESGAYARLLERVKGR